MKHIYKHLGYYNEVGDIRELSRKSADEIVDYYKKGYGAFYEDKTPEEDTNLIKEEEEDNIKSGDIKFTADGKYAIYDSSWDEWKKLYADNEDGDDSDCFIDIYELVEVIKGKRYTVQYTVHTYHAIEIEADSEEEAYELAEEKYCDFKDDEWQTFENTTCAEIIKVEK